MVSLGYGAGASALPLRTLYCPSDHDHARQSLPYHTELGSTTLLPHDWRRFGAELPYRLPTMTGKPVADHSLNDVRTSVNFVAHGDWEKLSQRTLFRAAELDTPGARYAAAGTRARDARWYRVCLEYQVRHQ